MGCFNDPAWESLWVGWWVADTNYLYPARWGWIKSMRYASELEVNLKVNFAIQSLQLFIDNRLSI